MDDSDLVFVRREMAADLAPPQLYTGPLGWMRQNLFSNWWNTLLTLIGIYLAYVILVPLFEFTIVNAVWEGTGRADCLASEAQEAVGACWAYIDAKLGQFVYGRYPLAERWRVDLVFFMLAAGLIPMAIPTVPGKKWNAIFLLVVFPIAAFVLLVGGWFGLRHVETPLWGGLLVTLVVAITGIVVSLPLGVLLALGRRSKMPIVQLFSIVFIEFWRGVPLITVLFMASVVLPLFLPEGMNFDKLLRALIGVALFSAAYMAEVVRGGLQAIPRGQYEGAQALGLRFWQMMRLIVLPQALKLVIPGIVNTFIGLFKDTTLVLIIGLFDLLGIIQLSFTDPSWSTPTQSHTGYLFAAMVFWVFCFGMSRYSMFMERHLGSGQRR
jgi:general L-amino acid transport system permease protein